LVLAEDGRKKKAGLIEESHCVHEYAGKTVHNSDQIDLLNPRDTVKFKFRKKINNCKTFILKKIKQQCAM